MTEPTKDTGGDSSAGGSYSASNEGNFGDTTFGGNISGPSIVFSAPSAPISTPVAAPVQASVGNSTILIVGILGIVSFLIFLLFRPK